MTGIFCWRELERKRVFKLCAFALAILGFAAGPAAASDFNYASGAGTSGEKGNPHFNFTAHDNTPSPPSGDMTLVTKSGLTKATVTCLNVWGNTAVIVGTVTKGGTGFLRFRVRDVASPGAGHDKFNHDNSNMCSGSPSSTITQGNIVVEDPPLLPPLAALAPVASLLP